MKISKLIKERLEYHDTPYFANDNISDFILPDELNQLQDEVEENVKTLLESLLIDISHDHNTHGTPKRIAKMFIKEIFKGRFEEPPKITTFPNIEKMDEFVITRCDIKSVCSHHFQNILGECYIGVMYADVLFGLSKMHRIVDWYARRPQIQEELTVQIADYIQQILSPIALGVVIKAKHHCVYCRGVEQEGGMVTSIMRGKLQEDKSLKSEFFQLIKSLGF